MSRLFDPMRKDGTFPFQITDKTATDVRSTWDRICPGWRERKPGDALHDVVRQINRVRAK